MFNCLPHRPAPGRLAGELLLPNCCRWNRPRPPTCIGRRITGLDDELDGRLLMRLDSLAGRWMAPTKRWTARTIPTARTRRRRTRRRLTRRRGRRDARTTAGPAVAHVHAGCAGSGHAAELAALKHHRDHRLADAVAGAVQAPGADRDGARVVARRRRATAGAAGRRRAARRRTGRATAGRRTRRAAAAGRTPAAGTGTGAFATDGDHLPSAGIGPVLCRPADPRFRFLPGQVSRQLERVENLDVQRDQLIIDDDLGVGGTVALEFSSQLEPPNILVIPQHLPAAILVVPNAPDPIAAAVLDRRQAVG